MAIKIIRENCVGCSLCVKACPFGALRLTDRVASLDETKCTGCSVCVTKCHFSAIVAISENGKADLSDYRDVWVFAEQRDGKLMNVALELIGEGYRLAREIGGSTKVCALLIGGDAGHLASECFAHGAEKVYLIEDPLLKHYTTDAYTKVTADAIFRYKPEIVLYGATHIGRDLAPRVAARCNTGLTADCTRLDVKLSSYIDYAKKNTTLDISTLDPSDPSTEIKQTRPAFGGNLMATIVCHRTRPQMATVRPGVMRKRERKEGTQGEIIRVRPDLKASDIRTQVIKVVRSAKESVSLTDADIICSGGRGLGDASGFRLMERFAKKVGGVVGASRAAVDAGWIDQSRQIGQTGTTVKPKIYFACGISGAVQHLAGMQASDVIVAINKDADAPIFEVADCGVVGDLYEIVPAIMEEWDKAGDLYDASVK